MGTAGGKRESTPFFSLHLQKKKLFVLCLSLQDVYHIFSFRVFFNIRLTRRGTKREYSQSNVVLVNSSITYYKLFIVLFFFFNKIESFNLKMGENLCISLRV